MASRVERVLVAYAVMGEKIQGADMYEGLWDFLRPFASQRVGHRFIPDHVTSWLADTYALHMPVVVMETLSERMVKAGLLQKHAESAGAATYVFAPQPNAALPSSDLSDSISDVLGAFKRFIAESANKFAPLAEEDLEEAFFDRLLNVDSLAILAHRDGQIAAKPRASTLTLVKPTAVQKHGDEEHLDYVFGRFLLDLQQTQQKLFDVITVVADAALVSEALLTYREPPKRGEALDGLDIYVDGPLCLDVLGVNVGREEFGREFVQLVQRSGARLFAFHHTILEIERVLDARKGAYLGSAGYPTERSVEPPATRERVRALAGFAEQFLVDKCGFTVMDGSASVPGAIRQRIGANEEQAVRQQLRNPSPEALETDVSTACDLMRLRVSRGLTVKLADAGPVLVTRNSILLGATNNVWREHLRDGGRTSAERVRRGAPLAMSERKMCGIAWITSGGSLGQISRRRLIANCAAATSTRRDVIARVLNILQERAPSDQDIFRAVITDQRAERALMDITRGDPYVVSDENVLPILDAVKEATARDVAERKDKEIAQLRDEHAQHRAGQEQRIAAAEGRASELTTEVQALRLDSQFKAEEERQMAAGLIGRAAMGAKKIYWVLPVAFGGVVALFTLALQVVLDQPTFSSWAAWKTWVLPGIGLVLPSMLLAWDVPDGLFGELRKGLCMKYVRWQCGGRVRSALLAKADFNFRNGSVTLSS